MQPSQKQFERFKQRSGMTRFHENHHGCCVESGPQETRRPVGRASQESVQEIGISRRGEQVCGWRQEERFRISIGRKVTGTMGVTEREQSSLMPGFLSGVTGLKTLVVYFTFSIRL